MGQGASPQPTFASRRVPPSGSTVFPKHRVQAPVPNSNRLVCLESGGHCRARACCASTLTISCRSMRFFWLPSVASGWTEAVQESISGSPRGPDTQTGLPSSLFLSSSVSSENTPVRIKSSAGGSLLFHWGFAFQRTSRNPPTDGGWTSGLISSSAFRQNPLACHQIKCRFGTPGQCRAVVLPCVSALCWRTLMEKGGRRKPNAL